MTPDRARNLLATGADRTVTLTTGETFRATVVEHAAGVVYLGVHPHLLHVTYDQIAEVTR